jgi:tripartite-type tricarboxylate transporter receptor subunit TctC
MRTAARGLLLCTLMAVALAAPGVANAQFPDRPLKFVVGFPPGGTPDTFLRRYTQKLSEMVGQPVVVENKPGAGAMVAAQQVATAKPDGYTVLFAPDSTPVGNLFLFKQLTYDPQKDLVLIAPMIWNAFVLLVNPQTTSVNSVADLTAHIKSKAGRVHYGVPNSGSQLMGESYKAMAGLTAEGVNFRGALDGVNALIAGEVEFLFSDIGTAMAAIKAGKVKPLAIASKRRPVVLPGVPSMADIGFPDFDVDGFLGAYLPSAAPDDVRAKLNGWINQLNTSDEIRTAMSLVGAESFPATTLAQNEELLRNRREVWGKLVAVAKIQPQ